MTKDVGPERSTAHFEKTVLVVDDEELLLELFLQLFEESGYQVDTTVSGRNAVTMLERKDYNLIIMDYKMPDMGGKALYLWLKNRKPHLADRVLFITGDTLSRETEAFLDETGLPYLAKPFGIQDAKTLVYQFLERRVADNLP